MRVWLWIGGFAVAGLVAAGSMMSKAETRPSRVSIAVEPHGSVLAEMSATVNGLPLFEWSLRGRTETRSPTYESQKSATLPVQLMWHDITADRYYHHDLALDAHQFSTFGEDADHAEVQIILGPGADITVTTPHPEALRLVGLNRMDEITPEMDVDVVLAELCATASTNDPSADKRLNLTLAEAAEVERATFNRDNWLAAKAAPPSRCSPKEGQ